MLTYIAINCGFKIYGKPIKVGPRVLGHTERNYLSGLAGSFWFYEFGGFWTVIYIILFVSTGAALHSAFRAKPPASCHSSSSNVSQAVASVTSGSAADPLKPTTATTNAAVKVASRMEDGTMDDTDSRDSAEGDEGVMIGQNVESNVQRRPLAGGGKKKE